MCPYFTMWSYFWLYSSISTWLIFAYFPLRLASIWAQKRKAPTMPLDPGNLCHVSLLRLRHWLFGTPGPWLFSPASPGQDYPPASAAQMLTSHCSLILGSPCLQRLVLDLELLTHQMARPLVLPLPRSQTPKCLEHRKWGPVASISSRIPPLIRKAYFSF